MENSLQEIYIDTIITKEKGNLIMGFERLSQEGFIHEFKQVSDGPHPSKFCFVLGAGASKSSGIKTGQELVDIWERELIERNHQEYIDWKNKTGITEENKYSYYSQYYEKRYQKRPVDGLNFLEKMMEKVNPNVGYVVLSYLLTKTNHNVVITTNFDHLAEDAVNYYAHTLPLIIGHESLAHYISKQITRPTIIKIHRDLLFDPKNKVEDVEILHDAWKESLGRIFSEYHPIFIGYAGNDNSLMDYLIENREQFKTGNWKFPYWTFYKSEAPNEKVEKFLNEADGYYIRCNGFDELLCLLGAELGYQMPTEEEFLNNTKSRYHELTEAFENIISAKSSNLKDAAQDVGQKESLQSETLGQAMQKIITQADSSKKYLSAISLENQGKYKESMKLMQELVLEQPNNARYHDTLSVVLHEQGRYEEAEVESRKAVELEPDNAEYHDGLSTTLHVQGKYEEAEIEARKAIEFEPDNAEYHYSLGVTLHEMNKYQEAEKEKRKAVELKPDNAKYHGSLSVTLRQCGKFEEAEEEARKAVKFEPDNARYHDTLSTALHEQKKYGEAEVESRKAVELEPDNARYHNSLGITLHARKKYEEAEEEKRKAIELEPDNAQYHKSLSITLRAQGKLDEADLEKRKAEKLGLK